MAAIMRTVRQRTSPWRMLWISSHKAHTTAPEMAAMRSVRSRMVARSASRSRVQASGTSEARPPARSPATTISTRSAHPPRCARRRTGLPRPPCSRGALCAFPSCFSSGPWRDVQALSGGEGHGDLAGGLGGKVRAGGILGKSVLEPGDLAAFGIDRHQRLSRSRGLK